MLCLPTIKASAKEQALEACKSILCGLDNQEASAGRRAHGMFMWGNKMSELQVCLSIRAHVKEVTVGGAMKRRFPVTLFLVDACTET